MRNKNWILLLAASLVALTSCTPPEKRATGFRLRDGNPEAGRQAFVDLKCYTCHKVRGADFPAPVADPAVPFSLGGGTPYVKPDGELVTSIINPSHRIPSGYDEEALVSGEGSRMGDYSEVMTVRQLEDLVAFLHTLYRVVPDTPMP